MIIINIPTNKSPGNLDICVDSIMQDFSAVFEVHICVSSYDKDLSKGMENMCLCHPSVYEHLGPRNRIVKRLNEIAEKKVFTMRNWHYLPIYDDVVFDYGALYQAQRYLIRFFPDWDGVVGFNQVCESVRRPLALIGNRFLKRYDNGHILKAGKGYVSAYRDVITYVKKMGRFKTCKSAKFRFLNSEDR